MQLVSCRGAKRVVVRSRDARWRSLGGRLALAQTRPWFSPAGLPCPALHARTEFAATNTEALRHPVAALSPTLSTSNSQMAVYEQPSSV